MGTKVHALLTQVQSGLAECITHRHPPCCQGETEHGFSIGTLGREGCSPSTHLRLA
jgi:hypothetical protein